MERHPFASESIMLQKSDGEVFNAFDIVYYKLIKKHLSRLGVHPYQNDRESNVILVTIITVCLTGIGTTWIQLYDGIRQRDLDEIIEDLPQIFTGVMIFIKLLNVRSNKRRFRNLFESVTNEWNALESRNELYMLDKFIRNGSRLAAFYRRTLTTFLVIFLSLPLINPIMDILIPLNETRSRHHIFNVDYLFIDEYEYFYPVYVHLSICSSFVVYTIITVDSLYITIIYHASGLFATCAHQIQQATEHHFLASDKACIDNNAYAKFKHCAMMHHEALLFHDIVDKCCRNVYLIMMILNMAAISVTAVEAVIYINKPDEFIRAIVFLVAQHFHLYVISLPGQVLIDQSLELGEKIYTSKWYQAPVNIQKLLYTMQMRCNRPCMLTAGGFYVMKIESFGAIMNTCMSYITMFLSMR